MELSRLDFIQSGIFAFLNQFSQFCYCPFYQKSIFGVVSKNILKVFLPEMQLKALSCWDLVRKGAKELNAHSHSWQERG